MPTTFAACVPLNPLSTGISVRRGAVADAPCPNQARRHGEYPTSHVHACSYGVVSHGAYGCPRAPSSGWRDSVGERGSAGEVFGADVFDEVLELVDDLFGFVFRLGCRNLADLVEQVVLGEQRRPDPHRQGDRVGRAA